MIERYSSIDMPICWFTLNTLVVSCAGLIPLMLVYVALRPGFGPMLMSDGLALDMLLRQVVTNGLLVVFTVNFLGFFLYANAIAQTDPGRALKRLLVVDPMLRVSFFIFLHGLIYFLSADWFGSFTGDHWLALRVVGPTLARSALFENLSGVYFYATLGSALPVYTFAFDRSLRRDPIGNASFEPLVRTLPGGSAAVLLALGLFGIGALLLTGIADAIVFIQSI